MTSGLSNNKPTGFPDPFCSEEKKSSDSYGLQFAKAIMGQWGGSDNPSSLYSKRFKKFEKDRKYASGNQDTSIYRQLLNSFDPNNGDGSMLNLDFTPVPILPKFVRIVVNKILSQAPYPNLEAVDPLSSSEKDKQRRRMEMLVKAKKQLQQVQQDTGVEVGGNVEEIPETLEEAEIFIDNNIKSSSEIAAQIATNLTLQWSDYNDVIFRRNVNDLSTVGMAVVKRDNDPNYGIRPRYVDPINFVHSRTEDPNFSDITYAGEIRVMSIQELKRIAGDSITEEQYKKIATNFKSKFNNNFENLNYSSFDRDANKSVYGYDEYSIEVLDFEFISVDTMYFEDKENKYGNKNFFYKGSSYKAPENSIFSREVKKIDNEVVYGGTFIVGTDIVFGYGKKTNIPKNIYDISKARMSYSAMATNITDMIPKSMVDGCIGFADQLQITHLKIQQAIAKAKPDGIIIDIEGLENVQLGKGGELQPLDLHDIYEQTGVFYYRSKNPEGGFQNPPIREINNSIRNINEMIALYNHYLGLIRDATGINEVMDGSSPKGDQLVGVRQQAIAAGNNAIYDITNSSMMLFKAVVSDIVKCLQILPRESIVYKMYENAIGKENMDLLNSFSNLYMYNFGVTVSKEMEEVEKQYLEQNIQVALSQKELDIEDAIAIRQLKDINQAERLLIVRRKKRIAMNQQIAQQNSQMQAQVQQQSAMATSQAKQQEMQLQASIAMQQKQLEHQMDLERMQIEYALKKEIEMIKAQALLGMKSSEEEFKEKIEVLKEDRKDERVKKQAVEQSKLISQRDGKRGELKGAQNEVSQEQDKTGIINQVLGL
jgi:hypothetical protein